MLKPKKILSYIILLISFVSIGYAANEIWCTQSSTAFSNCTTKHMYLYQDNNQNGLPDYSFVPKANYMYNTNPTHDYNLIQLMPTTNTQYFMSTGNMLYTRDIEWNIWTIDDYLFVLKSWAFEYKQPVRAIWSTKYVNIEIPVVTGITWINNPMVWFKYNFVLKKAEWYANETNSSYRRRIVPSLDYFSDVWVTTWMVGNLRRRARSNSFNNSTCSNYIIQRCGDKKISTHTWYKSNDSFYPVNSWVSTWFTPEICDSNTETGAACVNWTLWCCNSTCSWFGWADEKCGDEIIQPAGDFYNGDPNNMSFEECDDWDTENDTDGMINGDDPSFHFCSSICLPTFTEAFVEVFIN